MSSQFDADIPVASAPILMLSLPETQDTPQDVFHTPPEEQSLPSSVDVEHCAVNEVFYAFSQTQGSVDLSAFSQGSDLGKDSKLGFSEAQLSQEIVTKLVPDCSPGTKEVRVSERGISDLGESPAKKLKLLEQNLGKLVSDADGESIETRENGLGCDHIDVVDGEGEDFCREIAVDKVISDEENFETEGIQGDGLCEKSDEEHAPRRVLPISVRSKATTEVKSSEVKEKANHSLFDILKALAEDTDEEDENEDEEDNADVNSLFGALKESGITFPRPRWWPDHFKSVLPVEKPAKR